ncbi:MAG TPA: hypothetical protein VJ765_07200 [Chitinophagaceae bacterium]|nr:hypothetical protein [Chitinophagaceae bacterium]
MFIGHFALGLAAKKIDSRPSLGTMLLAAQFIDLLWPFFLLFGIESVKIEPGNTAVTPLNFVHYPWSHSLLAVFIWAIVFGVTYYLFSRNKRGAVLLAMLVISHWVLDFLTHRPDLPIGFSDVKMVGLGLWNNKLMTIVVEGCLFVAGSFVYATTTKAVNKKGNILFWSFFVFLLGIYVMNIYGPPPPDEKTIGYAGLLQWIFIGWGYWIDKNRIANS